MLLSIIKNINIKGRFPSKNSYNGLRQKHKQILTNFTKNSLLRQELFHTIATELKLLETFKNQIKNDCESALKSTVETIGSDFYLRKRRLLTNQFWSLNKNELAELSDSPDLLEYLFAECSTNNIIYEMNISTLMDQINKVEMTIDAIPNRINKYKCLLEESKTRRSQIVNSFGNID
jgi:hypothetical protein